MRAGQAGTALGLGRLGRSSNCSSFIYHQGQGADRTYRAVLIGNHDLPLYRISHPPRVVPTPDTIPRYKPLTMHERRAVVDFFDSVAVFSGTPRRASNHLFKSAAIVAN